MPDHLPVWASIRHVVFQVIDPMNIQLRPMTDDEFHSFREYAIGDYARAKREGEGLSEEEAQEVAVKSFSELLPDGVRSENQFLFHIEKTSDGLEHSHGPDVGASDATLSRTSGSIFIGYLWYAIQEKKSGRQAYLYNIDITPDHRGKGYGEAAMILLEDSIRAKGLDRIGLHVFGFNTRAQNLYAKLGYTPTNIIMVKKI